MKEIWDFTAPEDDDLDPERPSDLALDRLYADELDGEAAARIEARLAASPDDRARFEALDRHFDDIDEVDPRRLLASIRREAEQPATLMERLRAGWMAWIGGLVVVGAAVIAFFVLRPAANGPDGLGPGPDIVTLKGGPVLAVQRRGADGRGQPVASGEPVAPGDTLKFTVTLSARSAVRIIGVEADGARYDAFPLEGGPSPIIEPGEKVPLGGAVTLDDAEGRETLFLLACPAEVEPADCRVGADGPACPDGCRFDRFVLDKQGSAQ